MSLAFNAPGVYVQELPPASRTIVGVSTSLTAFVGRARRGPVDTPTRIFSYGEYERIFGGLWAHSPMSQAVRQYFQSGGADALIVRVVNRDVATPADAAATAGTVLAAATDQMTLRATADALAIPGLHHLFVDVQPTGADTFDLVVEARDADDNAIPGGGGGDFVHTVGLDVTADIAADLAAATTDASEAIALVELVGAPMTSLPDAGASDSYADAGIHYVTLSRTVGTDFEATAGAEALTGFDRLQLRVRATGGPAATTFDLDVAAVDASGVVLDDGGSPAAYTVSLDVAGGLLAALAAAQTGNNTTLVTAAAAPTARPSDGLYETATTAAGEIARLVVGLSLEAPNPGTWGNRIRASASVLEAPAGAFHLSLAEVNPSGEVVAEEVFHNLTVGATDARAVDRVLALESSLARVAGALPASPVARTAAAVPFLGGDDGADPRITEDVQGSEADKTGIHALRDADLFNLLCIPLESWSSAVQAHVDLWSSAATLCEELRAMLIVDPPVEWNSFVAASGAAASFTPRSPNAALYFPAARLGDPLQEGRLADFPPAGVVAGVIARTDAERGVFKAPAGTEATLRGVMELSVKLTDPQQGVLNQLGINCLRTFPVFGSIVWGARTLMGADAQASQWKYLPVRRLALFMEESLLRGSKWAVFEPNAEPLWGQLRASIGAFMNRLFREGAFAGTTPRKAYFVKCDAETTPPADVNRGVVNIVVGFAPLKPAEFVILKLQQFAGQGE